MKCFFNWCARRDSSCNVNIASVTRSHLATPTNLKTIYHLIWKGSYPKLFNADDGLWSVYYDSYIQTYLERDIRSLSSVNNELDFLKFMRVLAARTGQELEYSSIADEVGVSAPIIKSWVSDKYLRFGILLPN